MAAKQLLGFVTLFMTITLSPLHAQKGKLSKEKKQQLRLLVKQNVIPSRQKAILKQIFDDPSQINHLLELNSKDIARSLKPYTEEKKRKQKAHDRELQEEIDLGLDALNLDNEAWDDHCDDRTDEEQQFDHQYALD